MMMARYKTKHLEVEIEQVTEDNMPRLESWCNGSIKGTKLQPKDREIEFYSKIAGMELRATVGSFIIKFGDRDCVTVSQIYIDTHYEKVN